VDEAVEELEEIKDFPRRTRSGSRAWAPASPRACCCSALPARVRLFCASGRGEPACRSSASRFRFVEMFVGVGASRVRDLFDQAKQNQPCIISSTRSTPSVAIRGAGMGGGHDEREQTLNQLLVRWTASKPTRASSLWRPPTGPTSSTGAAAPRPASTGRSSWTVRTAKAAKPSSTFHAKGKPLAPGVNLDILAAQTPGFTGARSGQPGERGGRCSPHASGSASSRWRNWRSPVLRVIAGPEKKSRPAFRGREAHHRLSRDRSRTGRPLPAERRSGPQISIISRGPGLGLHHHPADRRKFMVKKKSPGQALDGLAGRVAEEIRSTTSPPVPPRPSP